jgi:hypothetical protein
MTSKYRCETCKHWFKNAYCRKNDDFVIDEQEGNAFWFISMVGCASHSDFKSEMDNPTFTSVARKLAIKQNEEYIRKDERDRVLDEVERKLTEEIVYDCKIPHIWTSSVERILKELRQVEG